MKHFRVFVDGQEGTTGLKIHDHLAARPDLELLVIDPALRKDLAERRRLINQADAVFLCLPDEAAREAVGLVNNPRVRVLDASTAHRTDPNWVYGLPELNSSQPPRLATATRVSVPGCHATGFVLAIAPLVQAGIVPVDYPLVVQSISGYTGGGKKLIARYEDPQADQAYLDGPQPYALGLQHKHLPEMKTQAGLAAAPIFLPLVGNFAQGLLVSVALHPGLLSKAVGRSTVHQVLVNHYHGQPFVAVRPLDDQTILVDGYLDPQACNQTNRVDLMVFGHDQQILIVARLDNLGKGASGAAIQCLNLMLGLDQTTGLRA
jgi:N-acetyl-gamma-glutamyl-phosphate reductase